MSRDLPVTVIGGYLGAGKTSLINGLLRQAAQPEHGLKLAVLVNDFGEIAVDADLIEGRSADNVLNLAGGCVCCTIGSDLLSTLVALPETVGMPDHVLVETSGVALPGVVAATVGLATGVSRHSVIVLADAINLARQRQDSYIADTIDRQLAAADLLVLTKTDQVEASDLREALQREFVQAPVVQASHGNLAIDIALQPRVRNADPSRHGTARSAPFNPGSDAASRYLSASFISDLPISAPSLARLLTDPAMGIIRAKGFINGDDGQHSLIQVVGSQADIHPASAGVSNGLVVIGLRGVIALQTIDRQLRTFGFRRLE